MTNEKKTDKRCSHLDKSGNCFCHKLNKLIQGYALSYCLSGYRKAWNVPKMDCHSENEKKEEKKKEVNISEEVFIIEPVEKK